MAKALGQIEKVTIHYFKIKGANGPATICMEQGNVDYEAKAYSGEEWPDFKSKTPTGFLPCLEYEDGTLIAESGAVSRVAAAQAGLLGEGRDFAISEMLIGMTTDLWKLVGGKVPTIMTIGNWSPEKTTEWKDVHKPKVKAKLETYVPLLKGDRFTGRGDTLGELELWYRLWQLVTGSYADILSDVPGLKPFYDRVAELTGPKKFVNCETKFGDIPNYFVPLP